MGDRQEPACLELQSSWWDEHLHCMFAWCLCDGKTPLLSIGGMCAPEQGPGHPLRSHQGTVSWLQMIYFFISSFSGLLISLDPNFHELEINCSAITAYDPTQPTGFLGQEETHTFLQSSQHMQLLRTVPQQGQSKCELVGWLVHSCSFPSLIWVTP